jgi:hypothetical protein
LGGEVKVTRASRDGGVDAIAFDPDPIRGGKIVIQAKRYTNTVELSAVRDLYGTVVNEGAMKGILVTTSSFGPGAYAFARDKPLTLLAGGNPPAPSGAAWTSRLCRSRRGKDAQPCAPRSIDFPLTNNLRIWITEVIFLCC